jgi:hypothetical protein
VSKVIFTPPSDIEKIKAKLDPRLNQAYFEVETEHMRSNKCNHRNCGVRLLVPERRVICKGCNEQIDAFDALQHYAASEQRLVSVRNDILEAEKREERRKQADKERRPWLRNVQSWHARKDLSLKAEPIIGWMLTLECGHKKGVDGERKPNRVTCRECEAAAKKSAQVAVMT